MLDPNGSGWRVNIEDLHPYAAANDDILWTNKERYRVDV